MEVRNANDLVRDGGSGSRCRTTMLAGRLDRDGKRKMVSKFGIALLIAFVGTPGFAGFRTSVLVLCTLGAIDVIRIQLRMLLLLLLRHVLPPLLLFLRQSLPPLADRLGKIRLTLLLRRAVSDRLGSLSFFAALAAEEDEGVLWSFDIVLVTLFRTALNVASGN
jgi:hypothetical protein